MIASSVTFTKCEQCGMHVRDEHWGFHLAEGCSGLIKRSAFASFGDDVRAYVDRLASELPDRDPSADTTSDAVLAAAKRQVVDDRIRGARSYIADADYRRILEGGCDQQAWDVVKRFLEAHSAGKPVRFLMLNGGTGIGKTVAAVNAMAVTDKPSRFLPVADVIRAFWQETQTAESLRETIGNIPMLVIDDIGTGKDRDRESSAVYEAVNMRQGAKKITIMTSNIPKDRLKEYDARLVERITHQGAIVTISGESHRRKQNA